MNGAEICVVLAERHWCVRELKAALERAEGTAAKQQRLLAQGRLLEDAELLEELLEEGLSEVALTRVDKEWISLMEDVADGIVALEELSEDLRGDREVVLAAVRERGWELGHATERVRRDREVVLEAVRKHGEALQHAAEELRRDRTVVLAAVKSSYKGNALKYAAEELFQSGDFALQATEEVLRLVPERLLRDRAFVLEAVQANGLALQFAPAFQDDAEVVFHATIDNEAAFDFVALHFRRTHEVIRQLCLYQNGRADLHRARYRLALNEADRLYKLAQEPD